MQILPYGLDGHQVKDVVGSMQLQRIVLLTDRIEVSLSCLLANDLASLALTGLTGVSFTGLVSQL